MFLSCSFAQSVSSKFRSIKFDEVRVPRKYNGTEPCIRFLVTRYPRKTPKLVLMRQQKKNEKKLQIPERKLQTEKKGCDSRFACVKSWNFFEPLIFKHFVKIIEKARM